MLKERVSGGCNVLHVLATVAMPPDPTHSTDKRGLSARTTPRSGILREVMRQSMAMTTGSTPSSSAGECTRAYLLILCVCVCLSVCLTPP